MNHSKTWLDLVWNKVRKNYHGHSSARLLRSTVAELANTQSAQSGFPISRRLPPTGSLFSLPFFRAGIVQHPLLPIHFPGRETDRTHETGTNAIPAISCIPAMYYQYGSLCFCSPNALWHPPQAPYIPAAHLLKFAWNTESERTSRSFRAVSERLREMSSQFASWQRELLTWRNWLKGRKSPLVCVYQAVCMYQQARLAQGKKLM